MKKFLLASTMLVASATLANAQALTISGEGRMGVQYDNFGFGGTNWRTEQRLTLDFNVAIEADHGLTFGAWTRARMSTLGWGVSMFGVFSGSRVWVEANGLRLSFGNMDGALATVGSSHGWLGGCGVGYEYGVLCGDTAGLWTIAHQENAFGPGANLIMASYEMNNYQVAVSHQRGVSTEIAARGTFGAVTVAAGYATNFDVWTLSGHYDGGAWGVGAIVADGPGATNWALSGSAQLGGGSLYGYVGREFGANAYGLSYGYGLGGGADIIAGAERVGANTVASVGVVFAF
jgi:hypothetical protein